MYVRREKTWLKHADFMILDIICLTCAFYTGYILRHGIHSRFNDDYWRLLVVLIVLNLSVALVRSSYTAVVRRSYLRECFETVMHCVTADMLTLFFLFLVQMTEIYSRESLLIYFVLQILFTCIARCVRKHMLRRRMVNDPYVEQMLILTRSDNAERCVRELSQEQYRNYRIIGIILIDNEAQEENVAQAVRSADEITEAMREAAATAEIAGVPVVAAYKDLQDYLLDHVVDSVFLNAPLNRKESRRLNSQLVQAGVTVHINLVRVNDAAPNRIVEKIGNYTVLTSGIRLASMRQKALKRVMDILGGLVGSLITVLATIVVGPIIYIQSPGPIYFKQTRVGQNGRSFQIYKFRSMYMDAEERKKELMEQNEMDGLMFKMKDDPRITPIGRVLRKYSIDEFPQFFNVLKGDMSLVGTRPPTADEYEQYQLHHRGRLAFKPGITGLWQVSGRNQITDFEEVVELDMEYIMTWTIAEDVRIILKTVRLMLSGDGE